MKKILSLWLAVIMMLSLTLTANAVQTTDDNSITNSDSDELPFIPVTPTEQVTEPATEPPTEVGPVTLLPSPVITYVSADNKGAVIHWNKVNGAEKYRVFVSQGAGRIEIGDTEKTEFLYTSAKPNQSYRYYVRCITADGSAYTSDMDYSGYTGKILPKPTVSSVKNSGTSVTIKWSAVNGAAKYRLFRKTGSGSWKKLADVSHLTYTYSHPLKNASEHYTVRCVDSKGSYYTSAYDTTGKAFTFKVLATPKITRITNDTAGQVLKWGKVSGAARYRVFVKSGSSWKKLGDTTGTSYTNKKAVSSKTYTYTVRCVSADGKSFISNYNQKGVSAKFIAAPKISSVTNKNLKITIKWNKVAGAEYYRVFYKKAGGSWKKLGDTTGTSLTYTHAASTSSEYYTVRCMNRAKKAYTSGFYTPGFKFTLRVTTSKASTSSSSSSSSSSSYTSQTSSYYVGSVNSNVYHRPTCSAAKRIKSYNRITFSTKADAQRRGYHACSICHP